MRTTPSNAPPSAPRGMKEPPANRTRKRALREILVPRRSGEKTNRNQSARHPSAEIIDHSQDRHLGHKNTGLSRDLFFDFADLVLFADGAVNEEQNDAEQDGQREQRLVGRNSFPSPAFLQVLGKTTARAPREPITDPTKELIEKTWFLFLALHFSASRASSTGLKGPPPDPPPPEPPEPTLATTTASRMKNRLLKKMKIHSKRWLKPPAASGSVFALIGLKDIPKPP